MVDQPTLAFWTIQFLLGLIVLMLGSLVKYFISRVHFLDNRLNEHIDETARKLAESSEHSRNTMDRVMHEIRLLITEETTKLWQAVREEARDSNTFRMEMFKQLSTKPDKQELISGVRQVLTELRDGMEHNR